MDQTKKRARPASFSVQVPRVEPIAELSRANTMSYNNHRPSSPGGRRIQNAGRMSESTLTDPYYQQRHGSYASPRSSGGVIPISTQTFVTTTPTSNTRPEQRYDSYSGRPRRSSLVDTQRSAAGSTTQLPSRTRPIIQQEYARPASPNKNGRDKDYYVTSASSQEPRTTTTTHKKLYSVDDGGAKLVADVNIPAAGERHHKRRDSVERGSYSRPLAADRDRGRKGYHANGSYGGRPKDKSIEDDDAYSYTDPAAMYRETEPRWREARTRRGSLDRGASSRERPVSVIDPTFGIKPQNGKETGPPPSTRGWDKINDRGRARNHRDGPRDVAPSPTRGSTYYQEPSAYGDSRDQYYVPPRTNSTDRRTTIHNYDHYESEDRMPRRPERRNSVSRDGRPDASVERRGFGLRRPESQTRYAASGRDVRGSDESFTDQTKYRDSGYAEPYRRDTAPDYYPNDNVRVDQERRDRELAQRLQTEEHSSRPRDRSYSDMRDRERDYSKDARRREDDRAHVPGDYPRDRDYDKDRERERDRARPSEPPTDRERERHHTRRDTDRDRDFTRKENSPRQSGENLNNKSGLSQAATGVLGGAAAALGLSSILNRNPDKRDKDKDRDEFADRNRERSDRHERTDRRNGDDREQPRDRKPGQAVSDDERYERNTERDRPDRGVGFTYEGAPDPPRSAPPVDAEWNRPPDRRPEERRVDWAPPANNSERGQDKQTQDRGQERAGPRDADRELERERDNSYNRKSVEQPGAVLDADEDYRRRMEQVQRELGRPVEDQRNSDSDPDRERRRREREQRQRERENRNGSVAAATTMDSPFNDMPPHPALRSFDDQSAMGTASTASTTATDLRRKPSILDRPMTTEPAQIIDNSLSEKRENRVRIVDPPSEEEEKKPRGILKKPTEKFPEDMHSVREGVAPLKDATKKGIPPGARWTKIDRRLVNPEALEAAQERFEERLDCVIVLRVLTKEEIQKLADRTREIRDRRYEEEQREERKAFRRTDRDRDRRDRDEYEYSDSEDEFKSKPPKMLELPSTSSGAQQQNNADFVRENQRRHEREREAEPQYQMSGGLGSRRDESQSRY